METRKLEKLNIETSLLGFGCMRFPVTADGNIEEVEAQEMLDKAIAEGVNYIDTAYPYHDGASEPFVGKALQKYPRDSYFLATKLPVWMVKSIEDVDRIFQDQLSRLQTDYIDFYLMHAMGKTRWDEMVSLGVVEHLEKLKQEGKIKYLGFSFHDEYKVFEEILNYRDWDFCQIQLNYLDTEDQAGIKGYQLTEEKNIPVIIMEPIKGGSLASFSEDVEEKFHQMDQDASIASFALRWVGSLPNVKVILSGMSSMQQVEDNLKTFKNFKPFSEEENNSIIEIVDILNKRIQNGCTGCAYCMPCPVGVDIPGCFSTWNTYHMFGNYNTVRWKWEKEISEKRQAKNCVKCGKCETVCPQKITIRDDLERVQADLDKAQK